MPRPKKLNGLFRPGNVPDHLRTVGLLESFYVSGLIGYLEKAQIEPRPRSFKPHLRHAIKEAKKAKWHHEVQDDGLWEEFSADQVRRTLQFELVSAPKGAMIILAAEEISSGLTARRQRDVYLDVHLVPALSYVSELTFEVFEKFKRAVGEDKTIMKDFGDVDVYMRQRTGQAHSQVFVDMVRGKTVTDKLARDFLKMLRHHVKGFNGSVEDDHFSRKKMIKELRKKDGEADPPLKRYAKKISASTAETFRE